MKIRPAALMGVLATTGLAAVGGGLAVYSGYDDAPGGVLLGAAMVIGAAFIGIRTCRALNARQA
ncbi:MAG TPA: hypothetical protein DEB06_00190 [Phycisphaerales bacterium]|nr:hypothetical protein [Phycisphaerales bacterium]